MTCVESIDHGQVRELRLARPPVNALNPALCTDLAEAVAAAINDGVHGLVLSGGPNVFSAGLDVPYLVSLGEDRVSLQAAWESFFAAARALA
jgi:enoyl-CoA hydratase/carnithine racemase